MDRITVGRARTTLVIAGLVAGSALLQWPSANAADREAAVPPVEECVVADDAELQDQDYEDDQLPWQRTGDEEVVIRFDTSAVTPDYLEHLKKAVAAWDRSPCIKPELVKDCPDEQCVTISLEPGGGEDDGDFESIEEGEFTTGGHITYYVDNLEEQGPLATLNVVIHEMGHAVGLRHRATPEVVMHSITSENTELDVIDYQNLLVLYGKQGG